VKYEHFTDDRGVVWVRRIVTPQDGMRWAGVPEFFWSFAPEPAKTRSVELMQALLDGGGLLLVLSGGTGCGKSTACAWALSRRAGLWVHAPDLAKPDQVELDEFGTRKLSLDDRMRAAGLLVLDDVGIEHSPGGYAASRITDVLEHRQANKRPSVVTTNLESSEFRDRYGGRIASRLNGDALGWQQIVDQDMRVAGAAR
jgi:DNA replication protein DnaC